MSGELSMVLAELGLSSRNHDILKECLGHASRPLSVGYIVRAFGLTLYVATLLAMSSIYFASGETVRRSDLGGIVVFVLLSVFIVGGAQRYLYRIRLGRAVAELLLQR